MYLKCLISAARKAFKVIAPVAADHGFALVGGTAVALRLGYRLSVDYDCFTMLSFKPDILHQAISVLGLKIQVLQEELGTLTISANGVKVSFFHYPHVFLEDTTMLHGVQIAGLIDIASMILIAIMQGGAKRDYIDLYWILQDIPFSKIAENLVHRYGSNRINPVVIGKALVLFKDADSDPDPEYLGKRTEWTKIKKYLSDHVQQFVLDIQKVIKNGLS